MAPFDPPEPGTVGTLRASMHRQLSLAANVGAQLGIVSAQVRALAAGQPVTLTAAQLQMIGAHPSKDAVDLELGDEWTLGVDDTLTPAS